MLKHLFSLAILSGLLAAPVYAQADDALAASWGERENQAAALLADGAARRSAAKNTLAAEEARCSRKFFVNRCRHQAYQEYVTANREGMRIENEGRSIKRQLAQERILERDRERQAELVQREATLAQRAVDHRVAHDADEARRSALQADKEAKAQAGAKRKQEDMRRLEKRQAAHAARVAEKKRAAEENAAAGR